MGVIDVQEVTDQTTLDSKYEGELTYTRSWKVQTDTGAVDPYYEVQTAVGVFAGIYYPGNGLLCTQVRVQGTDSRYLWQVQAEFTRPIAKNNPLNEPDTFTWSFNSRTVPAIMSLPSATATAYTKPVRNSAGDFLEGAEREIAETRLRIAGKRSSFPASIALAYQNCINSDSYYGGAPGTWRVMGIEATRQKAEIENGGGGKTEILYWDVNIELAYRSEGWTLQLLNVGYNEIVSGKKLKIPTPRLADLEVPSGADEKQKNLMREQHASSDPQALNADGSAKTVGQPPDTLEFHIYRRVPFNGAFPTPTA